MVSKFDYLPVPAINRLRSVNVPIESGGAEKGPRSFEACCGVVVLMGSKDRSATAHEGHDLEAVVGGDRGGGVVASRHDAAVEFDRAGRGRQAETRDQIRDRLAGDRRRWLAVDHDRRARFHLGAIIRSCDSESRSRRPRSSRTATIGPDARKERIP